MLFPIILLGLEQLVKEKRGTLYCITLGLSILSNYYISIMICIFMVIYVIAQMILNPPKSFGAFMGTGLRLSLIHICFLRFLSSRDRMRFRRAWGILWMMAACSVLFLLEAGFITSFLEIFIITGLCGYLRYMEQLLAA